MKKTDELVKALLSQKNEADMKEFIKALFTVKELQEMANRIQIIKQLKKGVAQHTIAKNLGAGVATITRGSRELKSGKFKNI